MLLIVLLVSICLFFSAKTHTMVGRNEVRIILRVVVILKKIYNCTQLILIKEFKTVILNFIIAYISFFHYFKINSITDLITTTFTIFHTLNVSVM